MGSGGGESLVRFALASAVLDYIVVEESDQDGKRESRIVEL